MQECWELDPKSRPSFTEIQKRLKRALPEDITQFLSELSQTYRAENEEYFRNNPDHIKGSDSKKSSRNNSFNSAVFNIPSMEPDGCIATPEPPTSDDGYLLPTSGAPRQQGYTPMKPSLANYPQRYSHLASREAEADARIQREYEKAGHYREPQEHYRTPRTRVPVYDPTIPPPHYQIPSDRPVSSSSNSSGVHSDTSPAEQALTSTRGTKLPSYTCISEQV